MNDILTPLKGKKKLKQNLFKTDKTCILSKSLLSKYDRTATEFLMILNRYIQNKEGYIYKEKVFVEKTAKQWEEDLMLSERTIRRIIKTLKEKNVIQILKLEESKFKQTNFITICYENL